MAEFMDPHNQMDADRKYTVPELIRALRKDIAAEEEATSVYEAHAEMTEEEDIKEVLLDIAKEERVHIGELQALIERLSEDEEELIEKGKAEVGPEQIATDMEYSGEPDEDVTSIAKLF